MTDRFHAREVAGKEGELDSLAVEVARLTYDQVSTFLGTLAAELHRQAKADEGRGRPRLAQQLADASAAILQAETHIDEAWDIAKPYMRPDELKP